MKALIWLSLIFFCFGFSDKTKDIDIIGTYEYTVPHIWVKLTIKRNKRFKYHDETHLFGILDEEGTWKISGDTLITTTTDTIIDKYLISKNKLCTVKEEKDESIMCLDKK